MVEQLGRDILLKVGDAAASENFNTIGGIRSRSFAINNEPVDISNSTDGRWRKLLAQAGITSVTISGNGVFQDDVAVLDMEDYALTGVVESFQLLFPNGDQYDLEAQVVSFSFAGEHNGEQTYDLTLESSGIVSKTTGA